MGGSKQFLVMQPVTVDGGATQRHFEKRSLELVFVLAYTVTTFDWAEVHRSLARGMYNCLFPCVTVQIDRVPKAIHGRRCNLLVSPWCDYRVRTTGAHHQADQVAA